MYFEHKRCRACGYGPPDNIADIKFGQPLQRLQPVLDLGLQPLANDFKREGQEREGFAPLQVMYCPRCSLAQLSVVVRPAILYANYSYITSNSTTMHEHFDRLIADLLTEGPPGPVIEIGSNDGLLLSYMQEKGFGNVCGIEPAENLTTISQKRNVPTIHSFCDEFSAKAAKTMVGSPAFILARHVFCHIHDWRMFLKDISLMADKETVICIEAPWAGDQLQMGSWDQVYFEHLSYLTVRAITYLLNGTTFHVHRVIHYPIHGGSILVMIRRNDSGVEQHPSVLEWLNKENITAEDWTNLASRMRDDVGHLREFVWNAHRAGKTVVGYGAAAKSTVWISACQFTKKDLAFVCDNTPQKQYTFSPGTDIPIVDPGALTRELPHFGILFAWNFANEIIANEKIFREKGGRWLVPVPKMELI